MRDCFCEKILNMLLALSVLAACTALLAGCGTDRPVVVERTVLKTDTVWRANIMRDTVVTRDSVFVGTDVKGDTVYVRRDVTRWREKTHVRTDTVWRTVAMTDTMRTARSIPGPTVSMRHPSLTLHIMTVAGAVSAVAFMLWLLAWIAKKRGGER